MKSAMNYQGVCLVLVCVSTMMSAAVLGQASIYPLEFHDCWTLPGSIQDLGFNFAMNLGRLNIEKDMRHEYPWPQYLFMSEAHPGMDYLTEDEESALRRDLLEECNFIFDGGDLFYPVEEYAQNYPNISFGKYRAGQVKEHPSLRNLVEHGGGWFNMSFVAGAVAGEVSKTCAGFINSHETYYSTWSTAMGFMLGYRWRKPQQPGHLVTTNYWTNVSVEEEAAAQIVRWRGCDVFSRFTDTNTIDKYVYSLGNRTYSIAKSVNMTEFVGDSAFTSLFFDFKDLVRDSVKSSFLNFKRDADSPTRGFMYNFTHNNTLTGQLLGRQTFSLNLTAATSLDFKENVSIQDIREAAFGAADYLRANNPLCNAKWRNPNGPSAALPGQPCPHIEDLDTFPSYLDLPGVTYYDHFTTGPNCSGGGQKYIYAENLTVRCQPCPQNTYSPAGGDAKECLPCPDGTSSEEGDDRCLEIEQKPVSTTLIVVIVGSAVAAVALIGGLAYYFVKKRKRRDNTFAPKDSDVNPIAIIFTDIQSSTNIWANEPDVMARAVDDHHTIIRKIIEKYQGYEVKTIGDAFMIVHKDITSAVKISLDIQRSLHRHDWGSVSIDDMYEQMLKDALDLQQHEDPSSPPPKKRKHPGINFDNRKVWNGLRVRIGISYGQCNCQLDVVTGGWDYYGTPVNTAARVEAAGQGGQTLMNRPAYDALLKAHASLNVREGKDEKHLLPASIRSETLEDSLNMCSPKLHEGIYLKGLKEPADLFEVLPVGFEGRRLFYNSMKEFDEELREDEQDGDEGNTTPPILLGQFSIDGDITKLTNDEIMMRLVDFALKTVQFDEIYHTALAREVLSSHDRMKAILSLLSQQKRTEIIQDLLSKWHMTVPYISEDVINVVGEDTPGIVMLSVRAATIIMVEQKRSILNVASFTL